MKIADITVGKSRKDFFAERSNKDFVAHLLGVQKDLAGCISTIPIYIRRTAEFEALVDAYISVGSIIRYLSACDQSICADVSVKNQIISYLSEEIDVQSMLNMDISYTNTVYSDLTSGVSIVPEIAIRAATLMLKAAVSNTILADCNISSVSIAIIASNLADAISLDCAISAPNVWHGAEDIDAYLAPAAEIVLAARQYVNAVISGVCIDVSINHILQFGAVVGDYYGHTLSELGSRTLSSLYFINKEDMNESHA